MGSLIHRLRRLHRLRKEFADQVIPFKPQPIIQIAYKGKLLDKTYQPDFVCFNEVSLEHKRLVYGF